MKTERKREEKEEEKKGKAKWREKERDKRKRQVLERGTQRNIDEGGGRGEMEVVTERERNKMER